MAQDSTSLRDGLIGQVRHGRLSPEEAETEAIRLGLLPFATSPDPKRFDPMTTPVWSAAMVIAWIAFRTADDVRYCWDAYRAECWDWNFRKWQTGVDEPFHEGHFLERLKPATIDDLRNSEVRQATRAGRNLVMRVADAIHGLWSALRAGRITAMVDLGRSRHPVAPGDWIGSDDIRALDFAARVAEVGGGDPSRVQFEREAICHEWPMKTKLELPQVQPPHGAGYMTLFHAALWIATKGGAVNFDPEESQEIWRDAYADLLAHIASGDVIATGVARGAREPIDGYLFADSHIDYPYSDGNPDLIFGRELFLCSYPWIDEEHWRGGFDDSLQDSKGIRWARLMVPKSQIAAIWPFDMASPRSGAPGRPTSMHIIEAEFERLRAAGELPSTLAETARNLAEWLKRTYPTYPPATAKTIETRIRAAFRAAKSPRK